MEIFGKKFLFFVLLLIAIFAIKSSSCQEEYVSDHYKVSSYSEGKSNGSEDCCLPGDYYLISNILVYYYAYTQNHSGLHNDKNSPISIAASGTIVHVNEGNIYFWGESTKTIQAIISKENMSLLVKFLNNIDVEKIFNELIGVKVLSEETISFAKSSKNLLEVLLKKSNNTGFLINLNGAPLYADLFKKSFIHLEAKTSPLCELITTEDIKEFLVIIGEKSSIIKCLRSIENYHETGWRVKYFTYSDKITPEMLIECEKAWKYVFGDFLLCKTLVNETHNFLNDLGLHHHTDKFDCVLGNVLSLINGLLSTLVGSLSDL
ncbi:uncharacterized protein LOC129787082 [Lutzomyia longipalpis]|uniref:uncharacterized protein LOC129787082 n=1 Tax=Lutzomyia longipalpis TaxID=7200 RepID=UPI0024840FA4|nr:uncharacterized protein LOC129787082 [Lutzomyia longipalpis]